MINLEHTTAIFWPNGMGETPCTEAYAKLHDEREAIVANASDGYNDFNYNDLSPEDYQHYCEIENELGCMQLNGHLGLGERY